VNLRVLIIEDDARYRASIETLVSRSAGFALAGAFESAVSAIAWLDAAETPDRPYDVALCDVELPRMSGIDAAGQLKQRFPDAPVVMLTVFEEPATILQAICAGADGYLLKRSSAKEILGGLQGIAAGDTPMSAGVARSVLGLVRSLGPQPAKAPEAPSRLDLTDREQDVLRELVQGFSYRQVASQLGISIHTVRTHVRALYKKLQVHSVAAAVTRAVRERLI
jgi:DNA-binding NarL/FixJ family response regulator